MNSKCCTNCIDKFNKVRKKNKKKVVLSICKNNIIKFIRNNVKNRIDPWKLEDCYFRKNTNILFHLSAEKNEQFSF